MTGHNNDAGMKIPVLTGVRRREMPQFFQFPKLAATVIVLYSLAVLVLPAKDGRDFAGTYRIKTALVQGQNVRAKLAFSITNYSGAGIAGGAVMLLDRLQPGKSYGSFSAAALSDRDTLRTEWDFIVPLAEYHSWLNGRTPILIFERKDSSGHAVQRRVELVRIP